MDHKFPPGSVADQLGLNSAQITQTSINKNRSKTPSEPSIAPISPGLWIAARRWKSSAELDEYMVQQAMDDLREKFTTPYYHEALARLTKDGAFKVDSRFLGEEIGNFARKLQWPRKSQPASERHKNFGSNRKFSENDDESLVFLVEVGKAAGLAINKKFSDRQALRFVLQRRFPLKSIREIEKMLNRLTPRISRTRPSLSDERKDDFRSFAAMHWDKYL